MPVVFLKKLMVSLSVSKPDICFKTSSQDDLYHWLYIGFLGLIKKGVMMGLERSELNASTDLISLLIRIKLKHLPNRYPSKPS